jgi:hypothetical protein
VIGLRPRDPVPLAIAGHRYRVDRRFQALLESFPSRR